MWYYAARGPSSGRRVNSDSFNSCFDLLRGKDIRQEQRTCGRVGMGWLYNYCFICESVVSCLILGMLTTDSSWALQFILSMSIVSWCSLRRFSYKIWQNAVVRYGFGRNIWDIDFPDITEFYKVRSLLYQSNPVVLTKFSFSKPLQ